MPQIEVFFEVQCFSQLSYRWGRSDSHDDGENPNDLKETAGACTSPNLQRVSDGIRTRDPEDHNLVL